MGQEHNALKHGKSKHPIYSCWMNMIRRCENPKSGSYEHYGGRGIKVCRRWKKLENFWIDMSPTWQKGLTLDRINVNGDYEPKNCRWATRKVQALNKRDRIDPKLRYDLNSAGIEYKHYASRLYKGWSDEKARTTPLMR